MSMTPKERKLLVEIHDSIHHQEYGLKRQMNYLLNEIKVNGDVGLESILSQQHVKLSEVYDVTKGLRSRAAFGKAWRSLRKTHPVLDAVWKLVTHRRVLMILLFILLAYLGVMKWEEVFKIK